jgi:hypothetical protein
VPIARWPVSVLAIAVPVVVGAIRIALSLHRPFTSGGDIAFIELAVRQTFHGGVALGPYSRFNWHHPGPSVFYLFAPLYWLSGSSSRSLFLDAWLLGGVCACGAVAIVRSRAGETTARLAAAVVGLCIGVDTFHALINPWNPSLLGMPALLLLVAAAAAASGSTVALVVAFVTASYLVQTHIGTLPVASFAVLVATGAFVWRLRSARRADMPRGAQAGRPVLDRAAISTLVVGAGLMIVMWGAPIVQQVTHANGNMTEIVHFFRDPGPATPHAHSVSDALAAVSDYATIVPLGRPTDLAGHGARLLTAGAVGGAGLAIGWIGWRRRRFVAWLGILSAGSLLVAVASSTRIVGPFYRYLFFYVQTLGIPAMIGAAAVIWFAFGRLVRGAARKQVGRNPARWNLAAHVCGVAAMGLVSVLVTQTVVRSPTASFVDSPDARAVAARIEALVGRDRSRVMRIVLAEHGFSDGPVLLTLAKDGYRYRVTPELDLYGGNTSRPVTGPTFALQSAASARAGSRLPGVHVVTVGHLDLWMQPAP